MKHKKLNIPVPIGKKSIPVYSDKPPKLRFKPGQYVDIDKEIFEIIYIYRVKEEPSEWRYCLEERKGLSRNLDKLGKVMEALELGSTTARIVYDCFRDGMDAISYFMDIPANGDRIVVKNKTMVQKAKLLSSGEVI